MCCLILSKGMMLCFMVLPAEWHKFPHLNFETQCNDYILNTFQFEELFCISNNIVSMKEIIPKRTFICTHDKTPFAEGNEVFSTLYRSDLGWERSDYCEKCWEQFKTKFLESGQTYWKRVVPGSKKPPLIPDLKALKLFKELRESKNEED